MQLINGTQAKSIVHIVEAFLSTLICPSPKIESDKWNLLSVCFRNFRAFLQPVL